MSIFGRKAKKTCCCTCGGAETGKEKNCRIKVLGSGCTKCNELERAVASAMEELGLEPVVGHVSDPARIAAYGVMSTPALVVDEQVVSSGRILKKDEIKALLQRAGVKTI